MMFNEYSSEQVQDLMANNEFKASFRKIAQMDNDNLQQLNKVGKIVASEFQISAKDWDKLLLILKMANSCKE